MKSGLPKTSSKPNKDSEHKKPTITAMRSSGGGIRANALEFDPHKDRWLRIIDDTACFVLGWDQFGTRKRFVRIVAMCSDALRCL